MTDQPREESRLPEGERVEELMDDALPDELPQKRLEDDDPEEPRLDAV